MSRNLSLPVSRPTLFNKYSFYCVLLTWCLLVSTVYARQLQPAVNNDHSALSLFASSGLQELVAKIPESTAGAFESTLTAGSLPERFKQVAPDAIRQAVRKAFVADTYNKYMVREMEQGMSKQSRELMLAWYTSPLGARVKRAELDNSLLTEQSRFETYQQRLENSGVSTEREQLIYRMDEIMRSTESAVDMMTNMQMAFNISLSRFLPEEQRISRSDLEQLVRQDQALLMAQYRNQTREVLLFTYQDFNNDELSQLNDTLATPAGQEFVTAINNGIKKGMFASALDLGDELGLLIGANTSGPGI